MYIYIYIYIMECYFAQCCCRSGDFRSVVRSLPQVLPHLVGDFSGFDHISRWKMVIKAANIVLYWDLTMKHVFFLHVVSPSTIVVSWDYNEDIKLDIMGRWSIPFGDSTLWQMAHRNRWFTYLESTFSIVYSYVNVYQRVMGISMGIISLVIIMGLMLNR